jgi:hypothetical protein
MLTLSTRTTEVPFSSCPTDIVVLSSVVEPVSSLNHTGIVVHLGKARSLVGCLALNANGLIPSVSLMVLRFNEWGSDQLG